MSELTLREAKALLLIDKYNLDDECINQSSVFSHVADQCAEAGSMSDCAKQLLAQTDADVAEKIRIKASEENIKLSEAKLQEQILLDERHQKAFSEYAEAKLNADKWYSMKEAFVQRSFMLKDLCGLFYAQYFTKESVNINPSAVEKEIEDNRKLVREAQQVKHA